jgi:DNA polymerase-3 subunit delta
MTVEQILSDIKARKFKPIYFLHGEESFYIDQVSEALEHNVLQDSEKGFNLSVLYGKDIDTNTLIGTAKRYPMMSEYQVVIVKEAQGLKFPKADTKEQEIFAAYLEQPSPHTILVFCHKYGTVDKRLKWVKFIDKKGILFESKKLYENQVPDWAIAYLRTKQRTIEQKAAHILAEFLGNDLSKVANELDKLLINTAADKAISVEDIEKNIGLSKDYNVFELNAALARRDVSKVMRIVDYFAQNKKEHPLVMTIANLNSFFTKVFSFHFLADKSKGSVAGALKISPFFVAEYEMAARNFPFDKTCKAIELLRLYDLRSKGVDSTGNTEEGELLKELMLGIFIA